MFPSQTNNNTAATIAVYEGLITTTRGQHPLLVLALALALALSSLQGPDQDV